MKLKCNTFGKTCSETGTNPEGSEHVCGGENSIQHVIHHGDESKCKCTVSHKDVNRKTNRSITKQQTERSEMNVTNEVYY